LKYQLDLLSCSSTFQLTIRQNPNVQMFHSLAKSFEGHYSFHFRHNSTSPDLVMGKIHLHNSTWKLSHVSTNVQNNTRLCITSHKCYSLSTRNQYAGLKMPLNVLQLFNHYMNKMKSKSNKSSCCTQSVTHLIFTKHDIPRVTSATLMPGSQTCLVTIANHLPHTVQCKLQHFCLSPS